MFSNPQWGKLPINNLVLYLLRLTIWLNTRTQYKTRNQEYNSWRLFTSLPYSNHRAQWSMMLMAGHHGDLKNPSLKPLMIMFCGLMKGDWIAWFALLWACSSPLSGKKGLASSFRFFPGGRLSTCWTSEVAAWVDLQPVHRISCLRSLLPMEVAGGCIQYRTVIVCLILACVNWYAWLKWKPGSFTGGCCKERHPFLKFERSFFPKCKDI